MARIAVSVDAPAAEHSAVVDQDILEFDKYFQAELGNAPVTPAERAIIKTYLWYKLHNPQ